MYDEDLGKFLAYILRHKPSAIGIELDEYGFAEVDVLIDGIVKSGRKIDLPILNEIVELDEKMRFSFNDDRTKIRANQGHSIPVDLQLEKRVPPDILYHGTAEKYLDGILKDGVQKRTRNYVHLSKDIVAAVKVGSRHGKPVVLVINAKAMAKAGMDFYISENGVWLTDSVPYEYIMEVLGSER